MATTKEMNSLSSDNTVIGSSILISGKLSGDEDLTVRGRVEGEVTLTKTLTNDDCGTAELGDFTLELFRAADGTLVCLDGQLGAGATAITRRRP